MSNKFEESDLGIAAFLVVRGFVLVDLVDSGGGRLSFIFDDTAGNAAEASMGFVRGESVSAREFVAAEKRLKHLLYSKKDERNGNAYGKEYEYRRRRADTGAA